MLSQRHHALPRSFILGLIIALFPACQLVKVKEKTIHQSIRNKSENILTHDQLSTETLSLLKLLSLTPQQCTAKLEICLNRLNQQNTIAVDERYAALSELYLAQALQLSKQRDCTQSETSGENPCLQNSLEAFDQSLRYSYVYLFKMQESPSTRVFDQRQMHVRSFYNVALSRLITTAYHTQPFQQVPSQLNIKKSRYLISLEHYPELKNKGIERVQSSYNLNFSGFYQVNRQDGLGAEFVVATASEPPTKNDFILDPILFYQNQRNPNIHSAQYLSVTATAQPQNAESDIENILNGTATFEIELFNPYTQKYVKINQQKYILTANYSVPFAYWLAENKLGSTGYLTLLDRTERLRMPHVYMLEPYQPNKKIIILIHGLASSPETWINLTNNILGDKVLRENFQVWQVFYSTNMPIFESRYQIHALIKQAFAQVKPNSRSASDAVLIGHSMGGVISRLLISEQDISEQVIPLLNYEQYIRLQQYPIIKDRFQFHSDLPIGRAVFIAAPHRGSELSDRWYMGVVKKMVKLPITFFNQVDMQLNGSSSTKGMVQSGPDELSPKSRFMTLTHNIMPVSTIPYHSIMGNYRQTNDTREMSDGIVPYSSSHLDHAVSEKIIKAKHSVHEEAETLLELRRILRLHLEQNPNR